MRFFLHPWHAARQFVIRQLIRLLTKPLKSYTFRFPNDLAALKRHLKKGDVILVEGEQRISEVVKYLTQSSWSHSAIYIGDELIRRRHPQAEQARLEFGDEANYLLVEALVEEGVVCSPLSKYLNFNLRETSPNSPLNSSTFSLSAFAFGTISIRSENFGSTPKRSALAFVNSAISSSKF